MVQLKYKWVWCSTFAVLWKMHLLDVFLSGGKRGIILHGLQEVARNKGMSRFLLPLAFFSYYHCSVEPRSSKHCD